MKPKIDITITDTNGAFASLAYGIEPYEVYINDELICTSERFDELELENERLRERIEYLEEELRKQGSAANKFMAMARTYQEDNKKLCEQVMQLQVDWESEHDYANQMEAKEKRAVSENDKLKEFCFALYKFAYDEYPDSAELNFSDNMRELGFEVDDSYK